MDQVSALDRGLMYGQCIFETIAINKGQPCLFDAHMLRLERGAKALYIEFERAKILAEVEQLLEQESTMIASRNAVLRINLTMGVGGRGYLNPVNSSATRILSLHDYPVHDEKNWNDGIELGLVDLRLAHQPLLAGIKHGNRLEQVIARSQWQPHWQEALVMDVDGNVIEGTQSNVFVVKKGCLLTPALDQAGVLGVMRDCVINIAKKLNIEVNIAPLSTSDIDDADEVFLTNSLIGLWPVKQYLQTQYFDLTMSNKLLKIIKNNEYIPTV